MYNRFRITVAELALLLVITGLHKPQCQHTQILLQSHIRCCIHLHFPYCHHLKPQHLVELRHHTMDGRLFLLCLLMAMAKVRRSHLTHYTVYKHTPHINIHYPIKLFPLPGHMMYTLARSLMLGTYHHISHMCLTTHSTQFCIRKPR